MHMLFQESNILSCRLCDYEVPAADHFLVNWGVRVEVRYNDRVIMKGRKYDQQFMILTYSSPKIVKLICWNPKQWLHQIWALAQSSPFRAPIAKLTRVLAVHLATITNAPYLGMVFGEHITWEHSTEYCEQTS